MRVRVVILLCAIFAAAATALTQPFEAAQAQGRQIPTVDTTSSVQSAPNGDLRHQTNAYVPAGLPSAERMPRCIESGIEGAGARCVNVCVSLPAGARFSGVETWAQDQGDPKFYPCDGKNCAGGKGKVLFEPSGYTRQALTTGERVCWIVRNWHPELFRNVILRVTFRTTGS
jgi:hypothetical protein